MDFGFLLTLGPPFSFAVAGRATIFTMRGGFREETWVLYGQGRNSHDQVFVRGRGEEGEDRDEREKKDTWAVPMVTEAAG